MNKYICAAFQRWPVVVQWVSAAPTLSGWTFVVRFAIFLHHNMPFPFVSSETSRISFSSIMQHHHQHRKHQKCKSHAIYSFPWKIYSKAFSWFLWSTSGLHQSHRKQPLPLPSHTCSGWIHLQWLRALPPNPLSVLYYKKIIWDECSTGDQKFSLGLQIVLDQRLSRTIDQKLWSLFFCFFV